MGGPTRKDIKRAMQEGQARMDAEMLLESPILYPVDPPCLTDGNRLIDAQLSAIGAMPVLLGHYVELLRRTHRLSEFIKANMGTTEDWPIIVLAESESSADVLNRLLDDVRLSVGALVEI